MTINPQKCAVLRIGPWKNSDAKFYTMKKLFWSPKAIRILGIDIYPDVKMMYTENYLNLLNKVEDILETWSKRKLTVYGKVEVINTLINSLFVHKLMALSTPPKEFFVRYRKIILKFLWNDKPHRIAYAKLIQDHNDFGIKLVDLEVKNLALKVVWANRIYSRPKEEVGWFYENLPIHDERIWFCNTKPEDIDRMRPKQYKDSCKVNWDIWRAWACYNYQEEIETEEEILSTMICGNSLVRVENKPIFRAKVVNSKVDTIMHIFNPHDRKLMSYENLIANYGNVMDFITYCSIRAAIPKKWKEILSRYDLPEPIDTEYKMERTNNIKGKLSRNVYWHLIGKYYSQNRTETLRKLWETDLGSQIDPNQWVDTLTKF